MSKGGEKSLAAVYLFALIFVCACYLYSAVQPIFLQIGLLISSISRYHCQEIMLVVTETGVRAANLIVVQMELFNAWHDREE